MMARYGLTRLAILAALAAGSLAKPVISVEKVVRQDAEQAPPKPTTITAPDGEALVLSSGLLVIGTTETVTLSTLDKPKFVTHGVAFTPDGGNGNGMGPSSPTAHPADPNSEESKPPSPKPGNQQGPSSPPPNRPQDGDHSPDNSPPGKPEDGDKSDAASPSSGGKPESPSPPSNGGNQQRPSPPPENSEDQQAGNNQGPSSPPSDNENKPGSSSPPKDGNPQGGNHQGSPSPSPSSGDEPGSSSPPNDDDQQGSQSTLPNKPDEGEHPPTGPPSNEPESQGSKPHGEPEQEFNPASDNNGGGPGPGASNDPNGNPPRPENEGQGPKHEGNSEDNGSTPGDSQQSGREGQGPKPEGNGENADAPPGSSQQSGEEGQGPRPGDSNNDDDSTPESSHQPENDGQNSKPENHNDDEHSTPANQGEEPKPENQNDDENSTPGDQGEKPKENHNGDDDDDDDSSPIGILPGSRPPNSPSPPRPGHGDNPKPPGDNPKPPMDNPKPPGDNPKPPGDNPKPPGDNPKPPGDSPKPDNKPDNTGKPPQDPKITPPPQPEEQPDGPEDEDNKECTTSKPATYETVRCTVKAGHGKSAPDTKSADCKTETVTTTVPCDKPTASATTTTKTEKPAPTQQHCSPRKCGGKACQGKRDDAGLAKRAASRASEPDACKWAGHDNYEDPGMFMPAEGSLASSKDSATSKMVPLDDDIMEGGFSSEMIDFEDKPASLAVPRLVGCTSIIVVSTKGAWGSHIWEELVFLPNVNPEDGKPIMPGKPFYAEGEDEFPAKEQLEFFKKNAIDRKPKGMFDDDSKPHVFMFMPYKRIEDATDPNYNVEKPKGLPAAWDKGGVPSPRGDDDADSYNAQIMAELKTIFGSDANIEKVLYAPEVGDPDVLEDEPFDNPRGRALVQYQPGDGNDCDNSKAKWRVFFERETEPHSKFEWDPTQDQYCLPPNDARRLMRRDVCDPKEKPSDKEDKPEDKPDDKEDKPNDDDKDKPKDDEEDKPEKPPPTPLEEQDPKCNNEDDFDGHAELVPRSQSKGSTYACGRDDRPSSMDDSDGGKKAWKWRYSDEYENNYDYEISWKKGCKTETQVQDVEKPLENDDLTCSNIFRKAYDKCLNGGVGGSIQVGCLVYTYNGGLG